MSLEDLDKPERRPSRQALAIQGRSAPLQVTGKLKAAIDHMTYRGQGFKAASVHAGLTAHAVRCALAKPHVLAYYRAQLQVLRESERARNIHRLSEIRDAANNMPAVQAIKVLEQLGEDQTARSNTVATPGLVVVINTASEPAMAARIVSDDT